MNNDLLPDLESLIDTTNDPKTYAVLHRALREIRTLQELRQAIDLKIIAAAGLEYRNRALEEAALECENHVCDPPYMYLQKTCKILAEAIRAKKSYDSGAG